MKPIKQYSPAFDDLISRAALPPLGPGEPNVTLKNRLQDLTLATAFAPTIVQDKDMAAGCLAGLWLLHNFLDESHKISQEIETSTGSYWHGIMHRREPDAGNAAYWFRRVGRHPIFDALATEARALGLPVAAAGWDAFAFIDLCEKHRDSGSAMEETLRQVQHKEWELLFDWCVVLAIKREGSVG